MKLLSVMTACALGVTASATFAFDLDEVKTKVILDLTGPAQGAMISSKVTATQPLEKEGIAELAGRKLRTRFWAVKGPGGIVPIHEHSSRPAMFTVASGEILEHSSLEEEPIVHKRGGLAKESGELAHWWHNAGSETVHLIAFDVQPVAKDYAAVALSPKPVSPSFDMPATKDAQNDLLGVIDLGEHFNQEYGTGWVLSTYRATIEPGGILPDFTGPGEPLQAFVWTGDVQEYRSDNPTPVTLNAHSGSNLGDGTTAYWKNTGDIAAEVYFGVIEPTSEISGIKPVGILAHGAH